MSTIPQPRVDLPRRVAAAREKAGISQAKLPQPLGFKNRQSLEHIESGLRRVTSDELLTIMEATPCDLDYFTDPFRLVGEGAFSYRASGTKNSNVDQSEDVAGRWLALWRHLGAVRGEKPKALRPKLALSENSRFELIRQFNRSQPSAGNWGRDLRGCYRKHPQHRATLACGVFRR